MIQLNELEFIERVNLFSKEIDEIIETGTFHGNGSTLIFAETGKPVKTIECNSANYMRSLYNLRGFKNVTCINGYSLPLKDMQEFIRNDDFYIEHKEVNKETDDPKEFYLQELGNDCIEEDILIKLIDNNKKQIIFLDSAGGVGYLEFKKVMDLKDKLKNKILIMDDIDHCKHYRSVNELGNKLIKSKSGRFGWCKF